MKGEENLVADTLSRVEVLTVALDYAKLAKDQDESPEIQAFRSANTALVIRDEDFGEFSVLCDVSTGTRRPLVTLQWRRKVFDMVHGPHGLSHAGPRPTAKAIAQRFVWRNYKKDVNFRCQQCLDCQKSKVQTHEKAPLQR